MDKLIAMKVFCRAFETESFKMASDTLAISRPMITRYINSIEEQLGTKLFVRNTRNISTTDAARQYYRHCINILDAIEEAESDISELTQKPKGRLKMSVPMDFGISHIVPLLDKFHRTYPLIELELDFSDKRVDMTESGVDLAIRGGSLGGDQFIALPLCRLQGYVCASPSYLEKYGRPENLAALEQHKCLTYSHSPIPGVWSMKNAKAEEESVAVHGVFQVNNGGALTRMALAGIGVIYQPDFLVAEHIREGRLVDLLPHYTGYQLSFNAIFPERKLMPRKTRLLLEFLQKNLVNQPL
ncbi:LysR family transcriptional regulator [Marinomonas epiphytica]